MPPTKITDDFASDGPDAVLRKGGTKSGFIGTPQSLKSKGSPLGLLQFFIVSHSDQTFYFEDNNARHFADREPALAA
jgi:hypothetical protein